MIFQSFILDNLVSLCLKIINSVIVVGLYYGFMTTFSTGPSYLFLLRAHVMEEGTEKKISATTGFITGQLMMFISIYYAPLHIALDRPHTITVITLPYLLLYFLGNNQKNFLNYVYKNQNSIRNFSIQRIFFQNLFFQLLNPFFLPSSILMRLANIYIFQSNNKVLFLTSSFVGWLIGHIFFMKWFRLILVWIQEKNNFIKSNVAIRSNSNKGILTEFRKPMFQIFLVFFFITWLYYLGRIPHIYFLTEKMSEIKERSEIKKKEGEINIERNSQRAGSKQEQKRTVEEKLSPYLFSKKDKNLDKIKEENDIFGFQKPLVTILFDYNRWNRPLRYIKNDRFENFVRNEISQFFFFTCKSDGKERISFTYPPNLSTFHKMMEIKISLFTFTRDKISYEELSNSWRSANEEKRKKLKNEFLNRTEFLDKESLLVDIFENRIRLCNDERKEKYLTKEYDPFLNGACRGQIQKSFVSPIQNETYNKNSILINKIYGILFSNTTNYPKFEQKKNIFDRKSLLTEIFFFFNLITKFSKKSISNLNFEGLFFFPDDNKRKMSLKKKKFLFDTIRPDLNDQKIVNLQKCIGINEIVKKLPRWSYNLIDELEQLEGKKKVEHHQIRSRKAKRVVLLTKNSPNDDNYSETADTDNTEKKKELALIRYSQQPDFRRDIIKGSIRAQRRKIVTSKLFQRSVDSPLFLEKMEKTPFFSFDILYSSKIFFMFENLIRKKKELKNSDYTDEKESQKKEEEKRKKKEKEEKRRIQIGEVWDSIIFAQVIRGCLLITQSIFRKYILLPSLIITKNIVRILLFQFPEWSEDFRDWNREMYIKCTYNGVQLSETEFPKKWLTDGIQIKILFPFRLKPWHRSKLRFTEKKKDPLKNKKVKKKNFCFLTIFGMEVELPFSGYPRNRFSFFDPILKELKKKTKNLKNSYFLILKIVNERTKSFITTSKETTKWIIQSILKKVIFLNEKINRLSNYIFVFRFKKKDELNQNKKNFPISKNNPINYESTILIQAINKTNCSLIEKKIKAINAKTSKIIKKIEKMTKTKENKRGFIISERIINSKKTCYDTKGLELEKKILQILQRRNVQLIQKLYSFFKFFMNFMKKVYTDIFLCIVSVPRINVQFFLESIKKIINQSIYNKKTNEEIIDKTNESIIHFISIINKSFNTKNTNSLGNSYEVSALSQAYVFLKISQIQVLNVYKYKFKYVFDYDGRSFFIKDEIKDYFFGIQGKNHSKLRQKNSPASLMNQWTNWLKVHYQYDLSQSRWSRLVRKNRKNRIKEHRVDQNKDLTKCDSSKKNQLIVSKNKKQQVDLLLQKNIKKQSRYDLLLYKFINYAEKKESSIYGSRSTFQANKKQAISYDYNTHKKEFFDRMNDISIKNYIAEDAIRDIEQNRDRKYFDWVVMDVKILNHSISNPKFSFFLKFLRFFDVYRNKPWIIPMKFLFLHFSVNPNLNKIKNITEKKKRIDIFKPWKKKKILELETRNGAKKEYTSRVDLNKASLSNQEKDIEEDYGESDSKKGGKDENKKKYKNKIEAEVNLLLRKYLNFHLNWKGSLNKRVMNNIKVYCLLVRLKNIKEIVISSIQRGELSLDIMMIQNEKDSTLTGFKKKKELIEKGFFIIEPVRLSRKNNEQFFMYETARLLLIHKSKRQINQRNPEKSDRDKQIFNKCIPPKRDQRITQNKEKNHYALVVLENILSARRRRELRILICFDPSNINSMPRKTIFYNENKINNCCQVLAKNKDLDKEKKKLMNLKFVLWPNYRLEDLACINRYWFDTHNGSRFSIVRIHMYPRLKIR